MPPGAKRKKGVCKKKSLWPVMKYPFDKNYSEGWGVGTKGAGKKSWKRETEGV